MGLKGIVFFIMMIVLSPRLNEFYQGLDLLGYFLGALFTLMYLEHYLKKFRDEAVQEVKRYVKEYIDYSVTYNQNNTTAMKNALERSHREHSMKLEVASNKNTDVIKEVKNSILAVVADTRNDISEEMGNTNKALQEYLVKLILAKSEALEGKLVKEYIHKADNLEQNIKVALSSAEKKLDDNTLNLINATKKALTEKLEQVSRDQQRKLDGVTSAVAASFGTLDSNLAMFRDCLEENLKTVILMSENAGKNRDQIIKAIESIEVSPGQPKKNEKNLVQDIITEQAEGVTVINTKKDGVTIHSEMRENNLLAFIAGYNNGRIVFSKNFDEEGNLAAETFYSKDGQVKERRTYRKINNKISAEIEKY